MYNEMLCRQISTILDINNDILYDEKIETLLSKYGKDELHNALWIVHKDIYDQLIAEYLIHISNPSENNLSSLSYYAYQLINLEGVLKKKNITLENSTSFNENFFNKEEICNDILNKDYIHILGKVVEKQKEIRDIESILQMITENPFYYDKSEIYLALLDKMPLWKENRHKYENSVEYLINNFVKKQKLDSVHIYNQFIIEYEEEIRDSHWPTLITDNNEENTKIMLRKLLDIDPFCENPDYAKILRKKIRKQVEYLEGISDMLNHLEPNERIYRMNKIVGPLLLREKITTCRFELSVPIEPNKIEYELYRSAKKYIDISFYEQLLKESKNSVARWMHDAEKAAELGADTGALFSGC